MTFFSPDKKNAEISSYTEWEWTHESFEEMGLNAGLLQGIHAYDLKTPFTVQQKGIVPFSSGYDIIMQGQLESGKTVTMSVGILNNLDCSVNQCQALILAPTKVLAKQIEKLMRSLGEYLHVKVHACVGGTSVREDKRTLGAGVHVVVGTPGRVFDMLRRRALVPDHIKMFCLDGADALLSGEFKGQVNRIFELLPPKPQVGFFSTMLPPEASEMTKKFMNKPVVFLIKKEELISETIKQFYVNVQDEKLKFDKLCELYDTLSFDQSVIFAKSKRKVDSLANQLRNRDHAVSAIHRDKDQDTQDAMISEFHSGSSRILVTTDSFAQGLNFQHVSLVVNYDLPLQPENYLYRIGRIGKFGQNGVVINFVCREDEELMTELTKFYTTTMVELPQNLADLLQEMQD